MNLDGEPDDSGNLDFNVTSPHFEDSHKKRKLGKGKVYYLLVGTVGLVGLAAAAVVVLQLLGVEIWPRLDSWEQIDYPNGSALFYTKHVKNDEAHRLGQFLQKEGLFSLKKEAWQFAEAQAISVVFDKEGDTFIVSFFVSKAGLEEGNASYFAELRRSISQEVLPNEKLAIQLCDPTIIIGPAPVRLNVKKTIR